MGAKSLQSCPSLCDPMDCSPPGSSVHGILQARMLEWAAVSSSKGSSEPGIEPASLMSPALAGGFFTTSATMGLAKKFVQAFLQDLTNFLANPEFGVIRELFPCFLSPCPSMIISFSDYYINMNIDLGTDRHKQMQI